MKKFLTLILALTMTCLPLITVSAESLPSETAVMMGDVNLDGKITASDARAVLRISAKLDSSEGISMLSVDTDNNGKITSADARTVLRVAAKVGSFSCGFDGQGFAHSISVIKNKTYYSEIEADGITLTLARDGENIYFSSDMLDEQLASLGLSDCGLLILDGKMYVVYAASSGKVAMYIPESLYDTFGLSPEDATAITKQFDNFIGDNLNPPIKETINNTEYITYSYTVDSTQCKIYTDTMGQFLKITAVETNGTVSQININKLSAEFPENYFDLSGFDII